MHQQCFLHGCKDQVEDKYKEREPNRVNIQDPFFVAAPPPLQMRLHAPNPH